MQFLSDTYSFPPPALSATSVSLQDPCASLQPFSLLETEIAKTVSLAVEVVGIMDLREFCPVDLGLIIEVSLF